MDMASFSSSSSSSKALIACIVPGEISTPADGAAAAGVAGAAAGAACIDMARA
eukprot:CAMPEP_0173381262 /NCGR_PEP_ID=MMETSP1356-20130122/3672_1 /TAXON_ID=77927 ORGANISM="Hemiselmis virescens, Strain PCC157" /NCGR_SAMPLE_ID=MMETSP1356 /ASSEMBLY_ACC=CAM_ASM_000847 /LENGTH=52 /DNA_ID=CAMNT_0014335025 /DNA_START=30 /DNA_END=188 /DNA_ORIENTATION=+